MPKAKKIRYDITGYGYVFLFSSSSSSSSFLFEVLFNRIRFIYYLKQTMLLSVLHRFATKNVHNVHFYGKESFGKLAWMSTKVGEPVPINFLKGKSHLPLPGWVFMLSCQESSSIRALVVPSFFFSIRWTRPFDQT